MKKLIENYFTNLALELLEVGNLNGDDIQGILMQQEDIVKQYITDIIRQISGKDKNM